MRAQAIHIAEVFLQTRIGHICTTPVLVMRERGGHRHLSPNLINKEHDAATWNLASGVIVNAGRCSQVQAHHSSLTRPLGRVPRTTHALTDAGAALLVNIVSYVAFHFERHSKRESDVEIWIKTAAARILTLHPERNSLSRLICWGSQTRVSEAARPHRPAPDHTVIRSIRLEKQAPTRIAILIALFICIGGNRM